ncbi:hypothetical protein RJT34_10297 [Clitoria ternatea]|uniref:Uncharacterized protein n=1 Tax=Clitoria ternatea TaxID=43366 RepID=A0AAN9K6J7_CLITE
MKNIVDDVKAMLDGAEEAVFEECCIYRVPSEIRRIKEEAYTPKVVSIGPLHHSSHPLSPLHNMEKHKLIYCKTFLQQRVKTPLEDLINYVQQIQPNFRRCYSEPLDFTHEQLVKMILVDSCFVIELFWRLFYDEWPVNDTYLLKPWLTTNIRLDLLLLENQLPFFVLENMYNLCFRSACGVNKIHSFIELTFDYFAYYNRSNLGFRNVRISHFTDLIRIFHLQHPKERRSRRTDEPVIHLHSTTELVDAGVRFKVNTKSDCLLDLRFSGRVLEIPQLKVEDWTELLFRNMVALEQCHYPHESYITDYVAVLDFLVNTSRDVDVLVRKRVLVNWLGDSGSVANLFNSLWKNITHMNFSSDYLSLCGDLNAFCSDPWHQLKATLRHDYCNSPWQTAASVAGIVLLVLSLLQSVCSVLQVVHA